MPVYRIESRDEAACIRLHTYLHGTPGGFTASAGVSTSNIRGYFIGTSCNPLVIIVHTGNTESLWASYHGAGYRGGPGETHIELGSPGELLHLLSSYNDY